MKKIFLLSGSYILKEIPNDIAQIIHQSLTNNNLVVFIASNFASHESNDRHFANIVKWFEDKDIIFKNNILLDSRIQKEKMPKYIKQADMVFICGGDVLIQMKNIRKYGLIKPLRKRKNIIVGMSAGAINMAKKVVLAKDVEDNIPQMSIYQGIGLTNINIEPHIDLANKTHIREVLEASNHGEIILLDHESSVIQENDAITHFGKYYIAKKGDFIYPKDFGKEVL